jgi:hypothetical protein
MFRLLSEDQKWNRVNAGLVIFDNFDVTDVEQHVHQCYVVVNNAMDIPFLGELWMYWLLEKGAGFAGIYFIQNLVYYEKFYSYLELGLCSLGDRTTRWLIELWRKRGNSLIALVFTYPTFSEIRTNLLDIYTDSRRTIKCCVISISSNHAASPLEV